MSDRDAPAPGAAPPRLEARAYWTTGPGRGELRPERLRAPGPGECLVATEVSGISAGTERLVHAGLVPDALAETMRAPFQEGDFGFPVKYGYLAVGRVLAGPDPLLGRRVFALHPHQDRFVVPGSALCVVPEGVPAPRALLAGAVETALNGLWDAPPLIGDRVAVVGAGLIGSAAALLLDRLPLERLVVIEPDAARRALLSELGLDARAEPQGDDADLVVHASATEAGLNAGLAMLRPEGTLCELSWYGERSPRVELGGHFHDRRLRLVGSQVGLVAPARRACRTPADRLRLALGLLADARFDRFVERRTAFADLPATMAALDAGADLGLCPVVVYDPPSPEEEPACSA